MLGVSKNFIQTSPTQLIGLNPSVWLDASDSNTLYDATTGRNLVAADGAVKRWEDKSGNANHAVRNTADGGGARKIARQNGLDAILQDTDDFFELTSNVSGRTFIVVFKWTYRAAAVFLGHSSLYHFHGPRIGYNELYDIRFASSAVRNGTQWLNGVEVAGESTAHTTNWQVIALRSTSNVSVNRLADDRGIAGRTMNGEYAEVLMFSSALSDYQINKLSRELMRKWGI